MKQYNESDFTEWFDPDTKPSVVGVYATRTNNPYVVVIENHIRTIACFQFWDAIDFGLRCMTPKRASETPARNISSNYQRVWWRGLREKPEAIE